MAPLTDKLCPINNRVHDEMLDWGRPGFRLKIGPERTLEDGMCYGAIVTGAMRKIGITRLT
jgi:hypothetical protein